MLGWSGRAWAWLFHALSHLHGDMRQCVIAPNEYALVGTLLWPLIFLTMVIGMEFLSVSGMAWIYS